MESGMKRIQCELVDITTLDVDAIVNAANSSLLGGGGVDGAIHRAAGRGLVDECRTIGGCPTGEARITSGHNLLARYVIHTVGPIWSGGDRKEAELLAACYASCFQLLQDCQLQTIAFPAISTGVYGFPKKQAASIAVRETIKVLSANDSISLVLFAAFEAETTQIYRRLIADEAGG